MEGSKTPVSVTNLPGRATAVSAGGDHTCAVIASSAYCWGENYHGQLGDGTTEDRRTPTAINNLRGKTTAVSAGYNHTCALTDGGAMLLLGEQPVRTTWRWHNRGSFYSNGGKRLEQRHCIHSGWRISFLRPDRCWQHLLLGMETVLADSVTARPKTASPRST